MGKVHERIDGRLRAFVEAQHVFFVATAPSGPGGHVNVSPKGVGGTFAVLDEHTVAYVDLTASGSETIAHLRENGRITVMGVEGRAAYRQQKNRTSIDGLPGFDMDPESFQTVVS